jgi:3,4-dihydroxy 2-butanone 4-phosphate synthase/GTP cyclohydrolase II
LALTKGRWEEEEGVLVRVHSTSETGDILGALLEDYNSQTAKSLRLIQERGKGVFVYLRQSDKSRTLLAQLSRYKSLNEAGSTQQFELNSPMGKKDFGVGAQILRDLGVAKIQLLTNHPRRRMGLIGYGLEIVENIEL